MKTNPSHHNITSHPKKRETKETEECQPKRICGAPSLGKAIQNLSWRRMKRNFLKSFNLWGRNRKTVTVQIAMQKDAQCGLPSTLELSCAWPVDLITAVWELILAYRKGAQGHICGVPMSLRIWSVWEISERRKSMGALCPTDLQIQTPLGGSNTSQTSMFTGSMLLALHLIIQYLLWCWKRNPISLILTAAQKRWRATFLRIFGVQQTKNLIYVPFHPLIQIESTFWMLKEIKTRWAAVQLQIWESTTSLRSLAFRNKRAEEIIVLYKKEYKFKWDSSNSPSQPHLYSFSSISLQSAWPNCMS